MMIALHKNAATTPAIRRKIAQSDEPVADVGPLLGPFATRFGEPLRNTKSPNAETEVSYIATLYAIAADVRGLALAMRLATRQKLSAPIVAALNPQLEKQLSLISPGSTFAGDVHYALSHCIGLTRFLEGWS
jgi:hypothetical protein